MLEPTTTPGLEGDVFALRVGEGVVVTRDVLAEVGREAAGLPPTWISVPAGTRGKVLGWRQRSDRDRVIVEVYGGDVRVVVFVGPAALEAALPLVEVAGPAVRRRTRRSPRWSGRPTR